MKKRFTTICLALCLAASLAGCGGTGADTQTPAPETQTTQAKDAREQEQAAVDALNEAAATNTGEAQYGGTFIVGVPEDPTMLCSAFSGNTHDLFFWLPMSIGLLDYDAADNMKPVCSELAESYEFSDDFMHLTFKLRDAKWTDGQPITSEDVKFTIENVSMNYNANMQQQLTNLESVECPDESTVVINLSKPNRDLLGFWHRFYCSILPEHVWKDYIENYQDCPEYMNPTVTGGPFTLKEYVAGDHATYVRNEAFLDGKEPYLDELILKIIPDETTMGEALEAGEIDLAQCAAISFDECDRLRDVEGITVYDIGKELRSTVYYVSLNQQREALQDKNVRTALMEAIDQEALIDLVFNGYGQVSYSPIPNNSAFSEIRIEPEERYPYNPEDAAAKLDAAGYTADSNGDRGLELTAVVLTTEKDRLLSEAIRSYWAEVGVTLKIIQLDSAAANERCWIQRDYDMTFIDGGLSTAFSACANRYCSDYMGKNYGDPGCITNQRIDEIFNTVGTQDEQTQKELYAELQNLIAGEASNMWLQNWAPYAVSSNFGGFPARPDVQFMDYSNVYLMGK